MKAEQEAKVKAENGNYLTFVVRSDGITNNVSKVGDVYKITHIEDVKTGIGSYTALRLKKL